MPEPVISGDEYRLRITQVGTDKSSCSAGFQLVSSVDSVTPSINILSPTINSVALAGEEYTVEVSGDGMASKTCRVEYRNGVLLVKQCTLVTTLRGTVGQHH